MFPATLFNLALLFAVTQVSSSEPHVTQAKRRYDYKRSLKAPMKVSGAIPGYDLHEDAEAGEQYVRLSSSLPGSKGSLWGQTPNEYEDWEVEYLFYMSTKGVIGKDGVAFWYTEEAGKTGPVLGNQDQWKGVGVAIEPFTQPGTINIIGLENDGTKETGGDFTKAKFGSCNRRFVKAMDPVYVRITYKNKNFRVSIDSEQHGRNYINCFEISHIELPPGYYFGLSASSLTEPASDHDLINFSVYQLDPPAVEHDLDRDYEREHLKNGELKASAKEEKLLKDLEEKYKDVNQEYNYEESDKKNKPIENNLEAQRNILRSLDYLAYRLDKDLPHKTSKSGSNIDPAVRQDIATLTQKVTSLTKALNDARSLLTQLESKVSIATQSQQSEFKAVTTRVSTLSRKINDMMKYGKFDGTFVHNKFSEVTSRLWNIVIIGVLGGLCMIAYLVYRSRSQRDTRRYL